MVVIEPVHCSVCGESMGDGNDCNVIAMSCEVSGDHPQTKRVEKVFGRTKFSICYVCFLTALGVQEVLLTTTYSSNNSKPE